MPKAASREKYRQPRIPGRLDVGSNAVKRTLDGFAVFTAATAPFARCLLRNATGIVGAGLCLATSAPTPATHLPALQTCTTWLIIAPYVLITPPLGRSSNGVEEMAIGTRWRMAHVTWH